MTNFSNCRSRLVGLHKGTLDQQRGSLGAVGGAGEKELEVKQRILQVRLPLKGLVRTAPGMEKHESIFSQEKELKLKKALRKVRAQRDLIREGRKRKEFPVVAVVGYTNAGKFNVLSVFHIKTFGCLNIRINLPQVRPA